MLEERKLRLIDQAIKRHSGQTLSLCGEAKCWDDCFTEDMGGLVFWYNVGKDTRAIIEKQA